MRMFPSQRGEVPLGPVQHLDEFRAQPLRADGGYPWRRLRQRWSGRGTGPDPMTEFALIHSVLACWRRYRGGRIGQHGSERAFVQSCATGRPL